MKDWERKLMEKVAEDMREAKQICLRDYSEAMMWYSGESLLKVAPDIKIYTLVSGCTTLLGVNNILYMRTSEGFDPLGKVSELLSQIKAQEPQTDNDRRAAKAQNLLDGLIWMKSEALKRLNEKIPGLKVDSVDTKVRCEPSEDEDNPIEDGDIVLWMDLDIGVYEVSLDQLNNLVDIYNDIVIVAVNVEDSPVTYNIEYHMSYSFASWNGRLEDDFVEKGEE
jgi:hypothetical protein